MQRIVFCGMLACAGLSCQTAEPPAAAQRLAPGDLIAISVFQTPELATKVRLDTNGAITMPQAGQIRLDGETAAEAETTIATRLQTYLLHPQVQVVVEEFAVEPMTVLGAVRNPGVYSLRVYPDLAAVLAAAGGIAPSSGNRITITRGDQTVLAVELDAVTEEKNVRYPTLFPNDVIRVFPPEAVYVAGEVNKPGQLALPASGLTLLEALGMAGGVQRNGQASRARIVHTASSGAVTTEWVDAGKVMRGQSADPFLQPRDLVYVPPSAKRATLFRGAETALGVGTTLLTGLIIFH